MTKPFSVSIHFSHCYFVCLLCDPRICSAWRRWAGGGGFHGGGGGGFHGGGVRRRGMRSSGGGGFRGGSSCAARCRLQRSKCRARRSGGQFASRPGNNYSRPGGNFAGGNQRFGNSSSAPRCRRRRPVAFLWRSSRWPRTFGRTIGKPGPPETLEASTSLAGIAEPDLPGRFAAFRARVAKSGRMLPWREMLFPGLNRFPHFTIRSAARLQRVPGSGRTRRFPRLRALPADRRSWAIEDFRVA